MTNISTGKNGSLLILIAGSFWGTLGLFCNLLIAKGLTPEMIAFIRLFNGFLILFTFVLLTDYKLLSIDKSGLILTAIAGFVSQTIFNLSYFSAIKFIGISSSAILLYLSPLFLLIWSNIFFKESFTFKKIFSVSLCVLGCILAITGGHLAIKNISIIGISLGVLSALSYSLMSVFSKFLSKKYNSITIIIYSFFFGGIFTIPFINIGELLSLQNSFSTIFISVLMGLIPSALSYILYFNGISSGINLSTVGIISTIELVISVLIAITIFNESFNMIKILGIIIILISMAMVKKKRAPSLVLS